MTYGSQKQKQPISSIRPWDWSSSRMTSLRLKPARRAGLLGFTWQRSRYRGMATALISSRALPETTAT